MWAPNLLGGTGKVAVKIPLAAVVAVATSLSSYLIVTFLLGPNPPPPSARVELTAPLVGLRVRDMPDGAGVVVGDGVGVGVNKKPITYHYHHHQRKFLLRERPVRAKARASPAWLDPRDPSILY